MSLASKVAIVTGATSGIGRETALSLSRAGAHVFCVGRRKDRLQELCDNNKELIPVVCDITKNLDPLKQAIQGHRIDILVNNAGLAAGREPIQSLPQSDWESTIDTNIKALIAVSQLIIPEMVKSKSGDIINVGSIAGFQTYPAGSIYNATKFAVRALTEVWRMDLLEHGIRVMGIHPGMVETEFSLVRYKGDQEKARAVYKGMTPLSAADIAESIFWILSRPKHVTIQSLVIMPTDQANPFVIRRV